VNLCQVYAIGLWQSGDVRVPNPAAECGAYTLPDFGQARPSLTEATVENPGAIARHFARNADLLPGGLELGLFNAKFGSIAPASNPDYITVDRGSWLVLAGSIAVVVVIGIGAVLIWTDRRRWWEEWIRDRVWGWIVLAAMGSTALYAALQTRPRPSYLFPLTILVFAALGTSLLAIARRLGVGQGWRAVIPPLAAVALLLIPNHYRAGYANPQIGPGDRLEEAVSRLEPFRGELHGEDRGLLAVYPATDACNYVGRSDPCTGVTWNDPIGENLELELAGRNQNFFRTVPVDFVYADEYAYTADPGLQGRLNGLLRRGWHRLAPSSPSGWMLLGRDRPAP